MTLGEYIKARWLTHEEFARLSGLDRVAVTRYLNGTRTPDREAAVKIEHATGGAITVKSWSKRRKRAV